MAKVRQQPFVHREILRAANRRCAEICEEIIEHIEADPGAPHRTGALVGGYQTVPTEEGAEIVNPVFYWRFHEFGTHNDDGSVRLPRNPHVRRAIEAVRAENT